VNARCRTAVAIAFALGFALVACVPARAPARAEGFRWPTQPGWKEETIPFPLDFAPALPYRGVEELRFMPGFFDPRSRGFWSYVFVWWIEGTPKIDTATLTSDLRAYFVGLARAAAEDKFPVDASQFQVNLVPGDPGTFSGSLHVLDAFATRRFLDLSARGAVTTCAGHTAVLFMIAPEPWTPEKTQALDASARAFVCAK
jgi:hypothetical protein